MTPPAAGERIGPGHLVLVVGPSGAGKDTLLDLLRAATADDAGIMVARRVVTRVSSGAEAHDSVSDSAFDDAVAKGNFAIWWAAHGNKYAIPRAADDAIQAGRTVLCNVSRAVVAPSRERYARVTVALVTAPEEVLRQRLAARKRDSDGSLEKRVARIAAPESELRPDVIIMNVGTPEQAAAQLLKAARG
ncbi:MAG: phosphonate metabolism protein/1,5-bisphosphokinase (PRPP-forming) PhnN [Alphaproteobacteria bacterium]|nr:phosphonate metabolism protein/1,5-bisphosphokinase (PRPP-forming) PhnN [Alphaproteobacteria bacterium]